jgi:hypothetical protein
MEASGNFLPAFYVHPPLAAYAQFNPELFTIKYSATIISENNAYLSLPWILILL